MEDVLLQRKLDCSIYSRVRCFLSCTTASLGTEFQFTSVRIRNSKRQKVRKGGNESLAQAHYHKDTHEM